MRWGFWKGGQKFVDVLQGEGGKFWTHYIGGRKILELVIFFR